MPWINILTVIAALVLPISWGVFVHYLFVFAESRFKDGTQRQQSNASDYQI